MKISWQKYEDIGGLKGLQAFAEVYNFHLDKIIVENNGSVFWGTFQLNPKDGGLPYLRSYGIYDSKIDAAYIISNEDSSWSKDLEEYARRQWRRLLNR